MSWQEKRKRERERSSQEAGLPFVCVFTCEDADAGFSVPSIYTSFSAHLVQLPQLP
jgi:hypothetical protein